MSFNSLVFAVFFAIVYFFYLQLSHKQQNRLLLLSSCAFYGSWDWRFLALVLFSTSIDYYCAIRIEETRNKSRRKFFMLVSLCCNLGILGVFKYFNFFSENLERLLSAFGFQAEGFSLHIVLPLGISFCTFKAIGYVVDVFVERIKPAREYLNYFLFVIFFPLLPAGPIVPARTFLPQLLSPRIVNAQRFKEGCQLIYFGLMQKIVVADNLARLVDPVFSSRGPYNGAQVLLAVYAFAFQLYCDFAGYSNMARGLGKCMGFEIMVNFDSPYLAGSLRDFWSRWHISLMNWFRDYVYAPLAFGLRDWGEKGVVFSLCVTFFLCGLWHGAAWTFILWGIYHGFFMAGERLLGKIVGQLPSFNRILRSRTFLSFRIILIFHIWCFGLILFRAQSLEQAFGMVVGIFQHFFVIRGVFLKPMFISLVILVFILIVIEIVQPKKDNAGLISTFPPVLRGVFYFACYFLVLAFGVTGGKEFIYSQF